jgi:hypothetical protein
MPKKKSKRTHKTSSGRSKYVRINRTIRRLTMKVNRWKRYQSEIGASKRSGPASRWDTSGLEKHIKLLEKCI